MIITIEVKEVDALRKACALANAKLEVYTWTAQISKAIISEHDGSELSAKDAWHIASSFRIELEMIALKSMEQRILLT